MLGRLSAAILFALALAGAGCPQGNEVTEPRARRSTNLPLPRDGDIAVQEELDAARRAGTVEAYDLFLARQGSHRLGVIARRERAAIVAQRGNRLGPEN